MNVTPNQLQEGCIISEDIFSMTNDPIIRKNTILTEEHIEILRLFLVPTVKVETVLADGKPFEPSNQLIEQQNDPKPRTIKQDLKAMYVDAVKKYKSLFSSWHAGVAFEMTKVRKAFQPLIEEAAQSTSNFIDLLTYSTKEDYVYHHAVYVGCLAASLAKKMNYSKAEWIQIGYSGLLADAGMAKLASGVLKKQGTLSSSEYEQMKKHPIYSYQMIKNQKGVSESIKIAVLQHHERYDGTGYPLGSDGSQLHRFSQIVAVCDVFHAMSSDTYYRVKRSPFDVLDELALGQFGKFDLNIIKVLAENIIKLGLRVKLTSGKEAEIVFFDVTSPTRPMVKLLESGEIVHLMHSRDKISAVL